VTVLADGIALFGALTSGGAIGPSLITVALWELLWPDHKSASHFLARWTSNFSLFVLSLACTAIVTPSLILLANIVLQHSPAQWATGGLGAWLHLAYACLVLDGLNYALHRAMHQLPLLWRLHALHHSDVSLDVSTTVRHHPLEALVTAVIMGTSGALMGCAASEVAVYAVLETAVQLVAHADVRLPRLLELYAGGFIVTPNFHRLHHSSDKVETDSNYGQVFAFWDRLFGTSNGLAESSRGAIEFGLKKFRDDRSQRLDRLLLLPANIFNPD
jgi:sterol desaturase/sphingolipid hydroxylase (fatty acid hydroxylase superfamily)